MPITNTGVKRDGRAQYRVRVNYTDSNGKARQVERTAYGLAEAKAMEQELIAEYKTSRKTATSRMTINELFTEYERYHAHETRSTSHDSAMRHLRRRVLPFFADTRLDRLSQQALADWKNTLSEQKISLSTRRGTYASFSAMLNYAVKLEYIARNPLITLGTFKDADASPKKEIHYYTAEQFVKFIAEAKRSAKTVTDWGYYVFFCIAFYTGARKGEINALKWSDIDGNVMHIRRSISQKLKGGDVETPPKNKSSYRDLQIPEPLLKILNEHKERQAAASKLFSEDFRVCGGERPLRDSSINDKNSAFSKAAGLPHIRIHDYRHSHASLLANEGINIQEIARRLGHSNVQITWKTYSHLYPREEERALGILNRIFPF